MGWGILVVEVVPGAVLAGTELAASPAGADQTFTGRLFHCLTVRDRSWASDRLIIFASSVVWKVLSVRHFLHRPSTVGPSGVSMIQWWVQLGIVHQLIDMGWGTSFAVRSGRAVDQNRPQSCRYLPTVGKLLGISPTSGIVAGDRGVVYVARSGSLHFPSSPMRETIQNSPSSSGR